MAGSFSGEAGRFRIGPRQVVQQAPDHLALAGPNHLEARIKGVARAVASGAAGRSAR